MKEHASNALAPIEHCSKALECHRIKISTKMQECHQKHQDYSLILYHYRVNPPMGGGPIGLSDITGAVGSIPNTGGWPWGLDIGAGAATGLG